jgi:hypothetical protein
LPGCYVRQVTRVEIGEGEGSSLAWRTPEDTLYKARLFAGLFGFREFETSNTETPSYRISKS